MFKKIGTAALVIGAALTVLPAGAFAQERYNYGYQAPYGQRNERHEFREHARAERRAREWREHERRELRREYRHHQDYRYWR